MTTATPPQIEETTAALLEAGRAAFASGDRRAAHDSWRAAAMYNPYDARVWRALYRVVEDADDRRVCLENLIAIDPLDSGARRELRRLRRTLRLTTGDGEDDPEDSTLVQVIPTEALLRRRADGVAFWRGVRLGITASVIGIVIAVAIVFWQTLLRAAL